MNTPRLNTIGVIGLGYVGLPLVLAYCAKNFSTIGFDIDSSKIDHLHAAVCPPTTLGMLVAVNLGLPGSSRSGE